MKSHNTDLARNVMIARSHWDISIRVRWDRYLLFSRRIDKGLRELVARWAPKSPLAAGGIRRVRRIKPR